MKRVVITGAGTINALGQTAQQIMDALRDSHPDATVISQQGGGADVTIKLRDGALMVQQRSVIDPQNIVHNVLVRYPATQENGYATVVQDMVVSLSIPSTPDAPAPPATQKMEQAFWQSIQGSTHIEDFEAYLEQWPNGTYAAQARQHRAELGASTAPAQPDSQMELAFWQSIQGSSDPAMFQAYLDRWPSGTFAVLARLNLQRLTAPVVAPPAQVAPPPASAISPAPVARAYYTPARNTAERRAVMDAARVPMLRELGQKVIFLVKELRTDGEWCFLMAEPLRPDGSKLDWYSTRFANDWANDAMSDVVMVLMRRRASDWQVVDYVIGPTDVHWYNWITSYGLPEGLFNPG